MLPAMQAPPAITDLLRAWNDGDPQALERLMPAVYVDLRRQAAAQIRREGPGHTLQPTALVHELFLRLAQQTRTSWEGRVHFLAVSAGIMRRILVDHARRRRRVKRGGTLCRVPLEDAPAAGAGRDVDVIALDEALRELAALDAEQARLVELRFFAGLTTEETAAALGVSSRTVKRDWRSAKAWLLDRLGGAGAAG
jgi:RNA polymerase sigma factor (TIGR02999 family)